MKRMKDAYLLACQKVGSVMSAPSERQGRIALFGLGVALLSFGVSDLAIAQGPTGNTIDIDETRIVGIVGAILEFIEGSFGALIMVVAGIGAIVSAAFGQYRAALGLLAVAIGAFVLRSLVRTFFGEQYAPEAG